MPEYKIPTSQKDIENAFGQLKPYMNPTMAYYESSRCLFCYDAPCVQACPTGIDIPLFIRQINTDNIAGAAKTIYDANYFGNICGKVCPTEVLCEGACVYNHQNVKPIEIGRLQSFATNAIIEKDKSLFDLAESNGKKVAIIGAGPSGISCACELRLLGYEVDVFEAKKHSSGLALYGCAPYKVANEDVMREMDYLQKQFGFNIEYNSPIDSEEQLINLENKYDAIFLGIGLGNTRSLNIKGEDLNNCIGATEYIEPIKLNPLNVKVGKKVIVIGGGNTAMDAASESARLGSEEVTLAYRRSKEEMGAYSFEYELAKAAGVKGMFNVSPVAILGNNKVEGVHFIKTKTEDGRVVNIEGSDFKLECDTVILATGQQKQTSFLSKINNLDFDKKGKIIVDENTLQTSNAKYFAGGDAMNGGAEVVNAAAEGKKAARGIDAYLGAIKNN
ncbi:MAG TPA: NAD(P)-dependent oxidoreductase [Bacteroidetes bacterium]|nr:NAD(P)-dependent oxidoreductase [Bacteroidota bacterium]